MAETVRRIIVVTLGAAVQLSVHPLVWLRHPFPTSGMMFVSTSSRRPRPWRGCARTLSMGCPVASTCGPEAM